ncbi:hypothetical protein PPL_02321 [Heterostelium album PN500]|uniref:N-acetyltransferase domain-containing protein n=1 Tax=Heterostelium pallidum (strain ATCC 26659 / Pp 5 / PN500) TaxID=670386 RepID=D3B1Z6_HETP5|nr:hypothetical protein PPL_02321 [Heterostelium album PN500]EFA85320.1 hypothetical protein PPL_02321 [Heterostelium album PN500]|eukprot:XP_020437429.1 hypothetical protein PPL_02321 [Heterostelium album PN500]
MYSDIINIRYAKYSDIAAITDIYNYSIRHEISTFEEVEISVDEMKARYEEVVIKEKHPYIVATTRGKDGEIVIGYCYLLRYRARSGYRYTSTDSIYIHHEHRGKRVGSLLLERIIEIAKEMNYYNMIGVASGGNDVSIKLHKRFGFRFLCSMENVGLKFNQWINTDYFQLNFQLTQ